MNDKYTEINEILAELKKFRGNTSAKGRAERNSKKGKDRDRLAEILDEEKENDLFSEVMKKHEEAKAKYDEKQQKLEEKREVQKKIREANKELQETISEEEQKKIKGEIEAYKEEKKAIEMQENTLKDEYEKLASQLENMLENVMKKIMAQEEQQEDEPENEQENEQEDDSDNINLDLLAYQNHYNELQNELNAFIECKSKLLIVDNHFVAKAELSDEEIENIENEAKEHLQKYLEEQESLDRIATKIGPDRVAECMKHYEETYMDMMGKAIPLLDSIEGLEDYRRTLQTETYKDLELWQLQTSPDIISGKENNLLDYAREKIAERRPAMYELIAKIDNKIEQIKNAENTQEGPENDENSGNTEHDMTVEDLEKFATELEDKVRKEYDSLRSASGWANYAGDEESSQEMDAEAQKLLEQIEKRQKLIQMLRDRIKENGNNENNNTEHNMSVNDLEEFVRQLEGKLAEEGQKEIDLMYKEQELSDRPYDDEERLKVILELNEIRNQIERRHNLIQKLKDQITISKFEEQEGPGTGQENPGNGQGGSGNGHSMTEEERIAYFAEHVAELTAAYMEEKLKLSDLKGELKREEAKGDDADQKTIKEIKDKIQESKRRVRKMNDFIKAARVYNREHNPGGGDNPEHDMTEEDKENFINKLEGDLQKDYRDWAFIVARITEIENGMDFLEPGETMADLKDKAKKLEEQINKRRDLITRLKGKDEPEHDNMTEEDKANFIKDLTDKLGEDQAKRDILELKLSGVNPLEDGETLEEIQAEAQKLDEQIKKRKSLIDKLRAGNENDNENLPKLKLVINKKSGECIITDGTKDEEGNNIEFKTEMNAKHYTRGGLQKIREHMAHMLIDEKGYISEEDAKYVEYMDPTIFLAYLSYDNDNLGKYNSSALEMYAKAVIDRQKGDKTEDEEMSRMPGTVTVDIGWHPTIKNKRERRTDEETEKLESKSEYKARSFKGIRRWIASHRANKILKLHGKSGMFSPNRMDLATIKDNRGILGILGGTTLAALLGAGHLALSNPGDTTKENPYTIEGSDTVGNTEKDSEKENNTEDNSKDNNVKDNDKNTSNVNNQETNKSGNDATKNEQNINQDEKESDSNRLNLGDIVTIEQYSGVFRASTDKEMASACGQENKRVGINKIACVIDGKAYTTANYSVDEIYEMAKKPGAKLMYHTDEVIINSNGRECVQVHGAKDTCIYNDNGVLKNGYGEFEESTKGGTDFDANYGYGWVEQDSLQKETPVTGQSNKDASETSQKDQNNKDLEQERER